MSRKIGLGVKERIHNSLAEYKMHNNCIYSTYHASPNIIRSHLGRLGRLGRLGGARQARRSSAGSEELGRLGRLGGARQARPIV